MLDADLAYYPGARPLRAALGERHGAPGRGPVPAGVGVAEALAAYRAAWSRPEVIHAMCQDYRAGATVDVACDEADRGRRTIGCPTLVLWETRGPLGREPDVLGTWRAWAPQVVGHALDCGHYLAEERPAETIAALRDILGRW